MEGGEGDAALQTAGGQEEAGGSKTSSGSTGALTAAHFCPARRVPQHDRDLHEADALFADARR